MRAEGCSKTGTINCAPTQAQCYLSRAERIASAGVCCAIAAFMVFVRAAATGKIDLLKLTGVCGFKDEYGLPCPTCGMTTAFLEFSKGHILTAFWAQPAGAVFFCMVAAAGVWTGVRAVRGVESGLVKKLKLKYIIGAIGLIVLAGWGVMIVRFMI